MAIDVKPWPSMPKVELVIPDPPANVHEFLNGAMLDRALRLSGMKGGGLAKKLSIMLDTPVPHYVVAFVRKGFLWFSPEVAKVAWTCLFDSASCLPRAYEQMKAMKVLFLEKKLDSVPKGVHCTLHGAKLEQMLDAADMSIEVLADHLKKATGGSAPHYVVSSTKKGITWFNPQVAVIANRVLNGGK